VTRGKERRRERVEQITMTKEQNQKNFKIQTGEKVDKKEAEISTPLL
jgi:hypothetical protein